MQAQRLIDDSIEVLKVGDVSVRDLAVGGDVGVGLVT
jgi:hypothetical protein